MADGAHGTEERAKFHAMTEGTAEDWMTIARASQPYAMELPERLIAHLKLLAGDCGGFAVDRHTILSFDACFAYSECDVNYPCGYRRLRVRNADGNLFRGKIGCSIRQIDTLRRDGG